MDSPRAGRVLAAIAGLGLMGLAPQAGASEFSIDLHGGTLGLGLGAGLDFNDSVGVRAGFNRLHVSSSWEEDDLDYDSSIEFDSAHALLDWHPFRGKFRFTGGVHALDHRIEAGADVEAGDDIGDGEATQDGRLEADIEYEDVAPYLGVGWDRRFRDSALGLSFDVGFLAQGNPDVELREVETTGASQEDLDEAEQDVEDEWSDWNVYPVFQLSLAYRF